MRRAPLLLALGLEQRRLRLQHRTLVGEAALAGQLREVEGVLGLVHRLGGEALLLAQGFQPHQGIGHALDRLHQRLVVALHRQVVAGPASASRPRRRPPS